MEQTTSDLTNDNDTPATCPASDFLGGDWEDGECDDFWTFEVLFNTPGGPEVMITCGRCWAAISEQPEVSGVLDWEGSDTWNEVTDAE